MFRSSRQRIKTLMCSLFLSAACGGCAINAIGQSFRVLSKTVSASEVIARGVVTIDLNEDSISADQLTGLKVKVEFLPSGEILNSSQISLSIGGATSNNLSIHFRERTNLNLTDKDVKISIYLAANETKTQDANFAGQTELRSQYVSTLETAAKSQIAYAKTSRERHSYFSGGFGGGEAAINPMLHEGNVLGGGLINQIDLGLALDRGTGTRGDPDFLNLGVNFRKIFPLHKKSITRLLPTDSNGVHLNSLEDLRNLSSLADQLNKENHFFRAIVVTPLGPRLETSLRGHGAGLLINFINNSDIQVRTGTKLLFGKQDQSTVNRDVSGAKQPRGNLTWEMKLIPVALEAGLAIRNPDDAGRKGNPIMRLNTGAVGKLTYHFPCRIEVFVNRIELEVRGMNRHLFNEESALNPLTNKADALVRGNKYAAQVDLRHVFGFVLPIQSFRRRPAVTVTYKNGFFPPLYTYNNSVSVHFTLESEDDTNVSDMKLSLRKKN